MLILTCLLLKKRHLETPNIISPKSQLNGKEPLQSSDIVITEKQVSANSKTKFNWKKLLKSSAWLALAGVGVLLIAATQIQMSSGCLCKN